MILTGHSLNNCPAVLVHFVLGILHTGILNGTPTSYTLINTIHHKKSTREPEPFYSILNNERTMEETNVQQDNNQEQIILVQHDYEDYASKEVDEPIQLNAKGGVKVSFKFFETNICFIYLSSDDVSRFHFPLSFTGCWNKSTFTTFPFKSTSRGNLTDELFVFMTSRDSKHTFNLYSLEMLNTLAFVAN